MFNVVWFDESKRANVIRKHSNLPKDKIKFYFAQTKAKFMLLISEIGIKNIDLLIIDQNTYESSLEEVFSIVSGTRCLVHDISDCEMLAIIISVSNFGAIIIRNSNLNVEVEDFHFPIPTNPVEEGVNHINCYTGAKTQLGRMLSNFYSCNLYHETMNVKWNTLEGYWQFLFIKHICIEFGFNFDENKFIQKLSTCSGYDAFLLSKKFKESVSKFCNIKQVKYEYQSSDSFRKDMSYALDCKIYMSDISGQLKKLMKENDLPYCHYYNYGNGNVETMYDWFFIDMMRDKSNRLKGIAHNKYEEVK